MKTQNEARAQALAKTHSATSGGLEKDVFSPTEICNECGRSVAAGSGRFVNRVPDLDDIDTRKENGKPYPEGDFICAECDEKARVDKWHSIAWEFFNAPGSMSPFYRRLCMAIQTADMNNTTRLQKGFPELVKYVKEGI